MTTMALAQRCGLARGTVHARLERFRERGVLRLNSARVDPATLGRPMSAMVAVELDQHDISGAIDGLAQIPEVLECFAPAGETDLLVRVVARDPDDLYRVSEEIRLCPGVTRTARASTCAASSPTVSTRCCAKASTNRRLRATGGGEAAGRGDGAGDDVVSA